MIGSRIARAVHSARAARSVAWRRGVSSVLSRSFPITARCLMYQPTQVMNGASFTRNFSSSSSTLVDALTQEIIEEDGDTELDQELLDAQQQVLKNFAIEDSDGVGIITLTRTFEDEKIVVEFDCQAGEGDADAMEGLEFEEGNEGVLESGENKNKPVRGGNNNAAADFDDAEDGDEMYSNMGQSEGSNFEVRITRGGSTLHIDCTAAEQLEIRSVRFIGPQHQSTDLMQLYAGPKFETLAEPLQTAFYEYLAERGVDDDMSFFVLTYSRDKEQREYVHWLKNLLQFSAKK